MDAASTGFILGNGHIDHAPTSGGAVAPIRPPFLAKVATAKLVCNLASAPPE